MKDIWMWPKTEINSESVYDDAKGLTEIEQYFSELYAPHKVVYFSRARVAIMAISVIKSLSRPQLTFLQPFSSHCVLSAISHQSTPTTTFSQKSNQQVVYHQWGKKTQVNKQLYQNVIIEDAVDSLILTNESAELFPNNAPFCLISLPKIIPVSVGAIIVCQHDADYQNLIQQRNIMEQDVGSARLHLNIPAFKEAVLQAKPKLVPVIDKSIKELVEYSTKKIKLNLDKINQIIPSLSLNNEIKSTRLPSNIIMTKEKMSELKLAEQELYGLVPFHVIEKKRNYFDYQQQHCEQIWLLPCHAQANWTV